MSPIEPLITLMSALAKREIKQMAQEAIEHINASIEHHNRSAGQSRRRWEEKIRRSHGGY